MSDNFAFVTVSSSNHDGFADVIEAIDVTVCAKRLQYVFLADYLPAYFRGEKLAWR
jgi:hypothetical protein